MKSVSLLLKNLNADGAFDVVPVCGSGCKMIYVVPTNPVVDRRHVDSAKSRFYVAMNIVLSQECRCRQGDFECRRQPFDTVPMLCPNRVSSTLGDSEVGASKWTSLFYPMVATHARVGQRARRMLRAQGTAILKVLWTMTLLMGISSASFAASPYPNRPIHWIVPVAAGGSTDEISRVLTKELAGVLGVSIVVENYPGAGGTIGLSRLAKAAPDGYTMALAQLSNVALAPGFYPQLSYDPVHSFTPVSLVSYEPMVFVVNPTLGVNSLRELIALAHAKPGSISFGSAGHGSIGELAGVMFENASATKMISVTYAGGSQSILDLMGGRISFSIVAIPTALPLIKSHKLVALAVTSRKRAMEIPDVPTVAESGFHDYEAANWYGVMMPANTPAAIVARIEAALRQVLRNRDVKDALVSQGGELVGSTADEFGAFIRAEIPKWSKIIGQSASISAAGGQPRQ